MESFTITVCLKSFFDDFRAKSIVFVDTTSMKKVKHVVHHIKTVFGIMSDAYMFSQDYFVPAAEDCRVLKTLTSIRLEPLSSSSKQLYNEFGNNAHHEQEDSMSVITTNSQDEIPNVDKDEHLNSRHSSKKKKHKRKRVDSDNRNHEYSSSQPDMSGDVSSVTQKVISVEVGQVNKKSKHNSSKVKDTPNGAFYEKACQFFENDKVIRENLQKENGLGSLLDNLNGGENGSNLNMSTVDGTLREPMASDSNANTDVGDFVPKRKRIRKRKKAAKAEDIPQDAETKVLQNIRQTTFQTSKLLTPNPNHIYFSEDEQEELETQAIISEVKTTPVKDSVLLNCPDNGTGEVHEWKVHNQSSESDNASKGQEISIQPSASIEAPKEQNKINQSIPSGDPAEYSGTAVVQTATEKMTTQTKSHSVKVERGLGKLLSLVGSDSPPVFERKKIVKNGQPPNKTTHPQVLPPAAKSSFSHSGEKLTPIEVMPAANTKICFKILKMSASYCPELSNSIVAIVKEINQETQELLLKIISGSEECKPPKGKFDLDEEAGDEEVDEIKLKWDTLIQPCTCE